MSQPPQPPYGDPNAGQNPYGQQQPYGGQQQPYGQQPQVPYGAPQMYSPVLPDHPQATTVLVLGIISLVACGLAGPFAWVMGNRVVAEIDASGGRMGGRSNANAGRICGIVGTVLLGLGLLVGLLSVVVLFAAAGTG